MRNEIYVLDYYSLNEEQRYLAVSLQGVLSDKLDIFIARNDQYECGELWLQELAKDKQVVRLTLKQLLLMAFGYVKEYLLIKGDIANSINAAFTLSGIERLIVCPQNTAHMLDEIGYTVKMCVENLSQQQVFEQYKHLLNKHLLIHQHPLHCELRDYAISNKALCFYTTQKSEDIDFRNRVFAWANGNSPILGWNDDELSFISDASHYGLYTVPADWALNLSVFSYDKPTPLKQIVAKPIVKKNKHHIAFVVSDGDNLQWMTRNFLYNGMYDAANNAINFPFTFTISPSLNTYAPAIARRLYCNKPNIGLCASVSGKGYINPTLFPDEHLNTFCVDTANLMRSCDLHTVALLDNLDNCTEKEIYHKLNAYSQFDCINGGFYQLDPDRYEAGKGRIFWSNGKPFVSVGLSLWYLDKFGDKTAWLKQCAQKLNDAPCNDSNSSGYTVVNVHPWSISIQEVLYFVSQLSDKVQIIDAEQLIELVTANVIESN